MFLVVATALIAECKTYLQLFLCQGFAVGISCGMIFGPVLTVIGHWFKRKRALAFGMASFGAAVGGVLFPIAARRMFEDVGYVIIHSLEWVVMTNVLRFRWTMRILALILFVTLGVANLVSGCSVR